MDAEAMTKAPADADTGAPPPRGGWLRRYAPLLVLVALMAGVFASGLHEHLTLNALARNRAALDGYVRDHLALSVLVFALAYVAAVVLSLPGATILTMAGGLLFGWFWGGTISVLAATAGAVGVFLVARSALGGALTARAGPWIDRLAKGFREDAFNYLLFLRLAPIFPFWLVNLGARDAGREGVDLHHRDADRHRSGHLYLRGRRWRPRQHHRGPAPGLAPPGRSAGST